MTTLERKERKNKYPDYVSVEAVDSMIESGVNPLEMMAKMKKLFLERDMEAELNHHLGNNKHDKTAIIGEISNLDFS